MKQTITGYKVNDTAREIVREYGKTHAVPSRRDLLAPDYYDENNKPVSLVAHILDRLGVLTSEDAIIVEGIDLWDHLIGNDLKPRPFMLDRATFDDQALDYLWFAWNAEYDGETWGRVLNSAEPIMLHSYSLADERHFTVRVMGYYEMEVTVYAEGYDDARKRGLEIAQNVEHYRVGVGDLDEAFQFDNYWVQSIL